MLDLDLQTFRWSFWFERRAFDRFWRCSTLGHAKIGIERLFQQGSNKQIPMFRLLWKIWIDLVAKHTDAILGTNPDGQGMSQTGWQSKEVECVQRAALNRTSSLKRLVHLGGKAPSQCHTGLEKHWSRTATSVLHVSDSLAYEGWE